MDNDFRVLPDDSHNRVLVDNVHPPDWQNPEPQGRYNLVVIGAGTAGLVTAAGAAGLGAKVALIEKNLMGGDCLNVGCVPSKALISAARSFAQVRDAFEKGVQVPAGTTVEFSTVMERMRMLRSDISRNDSASRFQNLGVDVFIGEGKFNGDDTIQVGDKKLRYKHAVIATGARASVPPIPGLVEANPLTNETLFSLTELPKKLAIIGAGPIGCEMAQSFARFGSEVFLIEATHGILPREDADAGGFVAKALEKDGIKLLCCGKQTEMHKVENGVRITLSSHDEEYDITVDQVLVSAGRKPNVENLNLEAVGVEYDPRIGVTVDDKLRTTNKRIYAAGDICFLYKFTHAADFLARIVIGNTLFYGRGKASRLTIPWCTYTDPEIAHVGLSEKEAVEKGIPIDTYTQSFSEVDRAILEGETAGFVKVHVEKGSDKILGATIVGPHAGDLISEITLAMTGSLGLKTIASTIHPYPTIAEAIRKVGDQYNRTRLTPFVEGLFKKWLRWTR